MHISWHGQFTVKIAAKQGVVVLDPYAPSVGLSPFRAKANIIGLTNPIDAEMSHTAGISDAEITIDTPGEYSIAGTSLHAFSWHDKAGAEHSIMRWDIEGLTLLHLGALPDTPDEKTLNTINEVDIDILFVPVGGGKSLNTKQALDLVSMVEPRIVIPIYFKIPKLKESLDGVEKFAKEMGVSAAKAEKKLVTKASGSAPHEVQAVILEP